MVVFTNSFSPRVWQWHLSVSIEEISAEIIPNSALGIFPQKQKEQRHKQLGYTDKLVTTQIKKLKNTRST